MLKKVSPLVIWTDFLLSIYSLGDVFGDFLFLDFLIALLSGIGAVFELMCSFFV
ncbi:hypothetical protein RU85_GL000975 [Lactococcus garvieae]|nr:hypothetical protein RU85_GL000975 [Lactococcus garvieae]